MLDKFFIPGIVRGQVCDLACIPSDSGQPLVNGVRGLAFALQLRGVFFDKRFSYGPVIAPGIEGQEVGSVLTGRVLRDKPGVIS